MSWFTEIFSSGAATIVDSVGTAIDKLVTSDQEKLQLKNELVKIQLEAQAKAQDQALLFEGQITERWKSDNEHIVTRLVRPIAITWLIISFTIMAFCDGNIGSFTIKETYAPVFETLLVTAIVALFGGRSAEKITNTIRKS